MKSINLQEEIMIARRSKSVTSLVVKPRLDNANLTVLAAPETFPSPTVIPYLPIFYTVTQMIR